MKIHIHVHSPCRGAVKRSSQIAMLLALAVVPSQSQILNRNLIVNGDAEASATSVPNWTTVGAFTAGTYGKQGSVSDVGPMNRGKQLFWGGPGGAVASASQVVDLSGAGTEIDAGLVKFQLSGYLGTVGGSYDNIQKINITADFQDASGTVLLHAIANGPTQDDMDCCMPAGLLERSATGFLPPKVRKAKITIYLSSGESNASSYAADNIALVLTTDRMFGANLLVNGDAEMDPGAEDAPVPGWNSNSALRAWKYGDYKMPKISDHGPAARGTYFFNCYIGKPVCQAYQTIDFSTAKALVDAGKVNFSLAGWLGSDTDWPDNADVHATYYDSSNKAIGSGATIGPVTMADRSGQIGLWQRSASGVVPTGARSVQVTISFHKLGPVTDNMYAYADNLSFTLSVMQVTAVVNAASWLTGPVAAGEFVTVAGSGLGPVDGAVGMQKGLAGSKVFFNGIEAWQTYTSDNQINVIVPYGVSNRVDVTVQYNGKTTDAFPVSMTDSSPGIFTSQFGGGAAIAVNNGISFNSAANPIARNGAISFWATGQGAVSPAGQDGEGISGWKELMLAKKVTIGGVDAQIQFAGLIYTGEIQVNAIVPANAPTGDVELVLTIGNAVSRKGVTISVK